MLNINQIEAGIFHCRGRSIRTIQRPARDAARLGQHGLTPGRHCPFTLDKRPHPHRLSRALAEKTGTTQNGTSSPMGGGSWKESPLPKPWPPLNSPLPPPEARGESIFISRAMISVV